jgi:hypothetical protein
MIELGTTVRHGSAQGSTSVLSSWATPATSALLAAVVALRLER